jgi:hypothetical protein
VARSGMYNLASSKQVSGLSKATISSYLLAEKNLGPQDAAQQDVGVEHQMSPGDEHIGFEQIAGELIAELPNTNLFSRKIPRVPLRTHVYRPHLIHRE